MKRPVHVLIYSDHAQNSEPYHCTIEHPGSFRLYTTDCSPVALYHRRIHIYPPTPHVLHTSTFIQLRTCYTRAHLSTNAARATHNTPQLTQHALPARAGSGSNPNAPSTQEPAQLIRPTRPAKCVSCPALLTATLLVPIQSLYIPACHQSTLPHSHYIPACPGPPWHSTYQLVPVHPGTLHTSSSRSTLAHSRRSAPKRDLEEADHLTAKFTTVNMHF